MITTAPSSLFPPPSLLPLKGISSMATRQILAELCAHHQQHTGVIVEMTSVGGVDAAKRVAAGEAFDVVILASDAIDRLIAGGHLLAGSRVDLVRSGVAVAVRAGQPLPDISTPEALKRTVLAAQTISTSTGPSGVALAQLFERWGIADVLRSRMVQAPPGVPVGSLVASGQVELGFQQFSELLNLPGITMVGPLPDEVQITTVFSAGLPLSPLTSAADVPKAERVQERVKELLTFMASAAAVPVIVRNGMTPA